MKKLYIHIGLAKTGTTSIQYMLKRNRYRLFRLGYVYPRVDTHILAFRWNKNKWKKGRKTNQRKIDRAWTQLERLIRKRGDRDIVISSEFFGGMLYESMDIVLNDFAALQTLGCRLIFVVYIRDQRRRLFSGYHNAIKVGNSSEPTEEFVKNRLASDDSRSDYYYLLEGLLNRFGKDSLTVRRFDNLNGAEDNVVIDFLHAIGIVDTGSLTLDHVRSNVSFPPRTLGILRRLNSFEIQNHVLLRNWLNNQSLIDSFRSNEFLKVDNKLLDLIQDHFAESNERVRAEFFPEERELFPIATEKLQIPEYQPDQEEMERLFVQLWNDAGSVYRAGIRMEWKRRLRKLMGP